MNGWNDPHMLWPLLISNGVGLVILYCSYYVPRIGRFLMFLLFIWAGCTNGYYASSRPDVYLDYAHYAFLPFYVNFINGWFARHITLMVGIIASCQLLIGISMFFKGWIYKLGVTGGICFLLGIVPLGLASGFPFPLITALAFSFLYKNNHDLLWQKPIHTS